MNTDNSDFQASGSISSGRAYILLWPTALPGGHATTWAARYVPDAVGHNDICIDNNNLAFCPKQIGVG
jgi:hypothetical protein